MRTAKELLDHRSMMIAVKRGVLPRVEFRSALQEQRRQYAATKTKLTLSEILIKKGVLTESQVKSIGISAQEMTSENDAQQIADQNEFQNELVVEVVACPQQPDAETSAAPEEKECLATTSQKGLTLIVTKDGMVAYISARGEADDFPTLKDVHRLLNARNIVFGVIGDREIQTYLDEAVLENTSFQVAAGLHPEVGEPDRVTYHFETNPFRIGTLTEDGLMDWKERGEYPHVEKDAVLATVTQGKKSIPGKDIYGHALAVDEVPRLYLFAGKGVAKSKDRLQLIAKVAGQPQLSGRGNVAVIQTLEVKGDVGIETGHVDFDGHVEVRGAVEKGYRVKAESLRAKEILSDQIQIAGDVISVRGVFGANIRCGGRVRANHVNKTTIIAEGDVVVAREVVECRIITNGKCIVDGGTILSSEIYAKKGLKAGAVGSEAAHPSKLVVGTDQIANIKVDECQREIEENITQIETLTNKIATLKEESDRLNTELGKIAQVQDRHMVDRRRITDLLEKEKREPSPEEQAVLTALDQKISEIDKVVETLMGDDEKAQAQLVSLRNDIYGLEERNNALNEEIKEIELFAARDMGIPTLQITGRLYQNTEIIGPHDSMTIEKTIFSATIKEQKNTDKDAEKPYSFRLASR